MNSITVPASAVTVSSSTEGVTTAGGEYSIICTVTRPTALLATPHITWINPSGSEIRGEVNSTQTENMTMTVTTVTVRLDPLQASHSGLYTCKVSVSSPSFMAPLNFTSTARVSIQSKFMASCMILFHTSHSATVPQPIVEVTTLRSSSPLYAGSGLTLMCAVEIDASVDIPYTITVTWLKSEASISSNDRTTISNITQSSSLSYNSRLSFNPLSSVSDSGTYTCQVSLSPQSPFTLVQGASQTDVETITVEGILL